MDERERAFKKRKEGKDRDAKEIERENERIKEAGKRLREEKEKELLKKQAEEEAGPEELEDVAPQLGECPIYIGLSTLFLICTIQANTTLP